MDLVVGNLEEFILPEELNDEKEATKAMLRLDNEDDGGGKLQLRKHHFS